MTRIGLDATTIGKLQAIRPIITMCIAPMWGMVADRSGRKKMILLLTFVMSFISRMAIRYTIVSSNVQYFAMALCVTSIFYAPVPSLVDSMVISSLSEADKVNFGKLRLWGELGNGAASSIALRVINEYENNGFELAFLFHGISTVMALIFIVYCVPSSSNTNNTTNAIPTKTKKVVEEDDDDTVKTNNKTSQKQHHGGWKEAILFVFSNAQILSVFGLVAITGYSMGILENFCYINIRQLYADHGSMDAVGRDISIYRAFYTLGGTLTWFYSGYWIERLGSDIVMFVSICCLPVCLFLYAGGVAHELDILMKLGFLIAEAIRSSIFAALWSTATIRLNKLSPPQVQSVMQTMLEATYRGIGHTVGSYSGGKLCSNMGISSAFVVVGRGLSSVICMIGALAFLTPKNKKKSNR